jgi:hypothetical protein
MPLHLDGHHAPVGEPGAVHAGDAAAGDGLPLELGERVQQPGVAQGAGHRGAARRPYLVGEGAQRVAPVLGDEVAAGAEQLPALDEQRAQRGQQPPRAACEARPAPSPRRQRQRGDHMAGDDESCGDSPLRQQPPHPASLVHSTSRVTRSGGPKPGPRAR